MQRDTLVSAVIPTLNRPELVCRAVESVLAQTYANVEAIVVIDGRDERTLAALNAIKDTRLRVIALEQNVGGCEARNIGIRAAHGDWVALLDDDDEWLPEKTKEQLALAGKLHGENIFIGSQYLDRSVFGDVVQPRKSPRPEQPISEYLFCEVKLLGKREGFLQTSTWFISRDFLLKVPFTKNLKRNQDTDWLLRAFTLEKVTVGMVEKPLAIFYNDYVPNRVSSSTDWRSRYDWATENRRYFTDRAFSFYIASECVPLVIQNGWRQWGHLVELFFGFCSKGRPEWRSAWLFWRNALILPLSRVVTRQSFRKAILYRATGAKPSAP